MSLTAIEQFTVDQARDLIDLSADAVEQRGPHYVVGQAQAVIKDLLATIERLTGEQL
jgi:hypothetical protein